MCGRYVITNPVVKTEKLVKSAIHLKTVKITMLHTLMMKDPFLFLEE